MIYVQSTDADLTLGQVDAGGEVSLTTPGSILSAGTHSVQIRTPGDVRLLASTGEIFASLPAVGDPLPLITDVGGTFTTVQASERITLTDLRDDLDFDLIASGSEKVKLNATAGSILQRTRGAGLVGSDLELNAIGSIGRDAAVIEARLH